MTISPPEAPPKDDAGFAMLSAKITQDTAFRCASYKDRCLQRRIAARMRAAGVATFAEYATVLDRDTTEYPKLLDALTINVTRFFRNPSTWDIVARDVIPALWAGSRRIRVWCAGVSSGEEAYSLAALIHRHADACGEGSRVAERVRIVGSDIDRRCLTAARAAMYAAPAFVETPAALADRYFPRHGSLRSVAPELRAIVDFEYRDLLHEPRPPGTFDLITCRNVVIYFDRPAQDLLFTAFHDVLAPGGFLVLGRAETLLGAPRMLFRPIESRERIFRRHG
jgi:chemotaxis methyl-accepting protein methylase